MSNNLKALEKALGVTQAIKRAARSPGMTEALANWQTLHPVLTKAGPDEAGVALCLTLLVGELNREDGPRTWMVDRLYMRFSNLRRQLETALMADAVPVEEDR